MATIGDVRSRVKKAYKRYGNWRVVARELGIRTRGGGNNPGMAYRIANDPGYEPKEVWARQMLGLGSMAPAPVCEKCGVVHVSRRCTARPAMWMRRVWDTPVEELRWRLENREEF